MCFHKWREHERSYTPPTERGLKVDSCSQEFMDRLAFGFSTILLRCDKCGDLKAVQAVGSIARPSSERGPAPLKPGDELHTKTIWSTGK